MKVFAVDLMGRCPAGRVVVVQSLGTVAAAGFVLAKRAAHRRWARYRTESTWLRIEGARERETGPGRRSGHGGL